MCLGRERLTAGPLETGNQEHSSPGFELFFLFRALFLLLSLPKHSWWRHIFALHSAGRSGNIPYVILSLFLLLLLCKIINIKLQPCKNRHAGALGSPKNPSSTPGSHAVFQQFYLSTQPRVFHSYNKQAPGLQVPRRDTARPHHRLSQQDLFSARSGDAQHTASRGRTQILAFGSFSILSV